MTVSLENVIDPFDRVKLAHLRALLEVAAATALGDEMHIRRRFLETSRDYDHTLNLLSHVGLVERNEDGVKRLPIESANGDIAEVILNRLTSTPGMYRDALVEFFAAFTVQDNIPTMQPAFEARGAFSHLRNLLIECGVVVHDDARDCYLITREYFALYVEMSSKKPMSSVLVDRSIQDAVRIGNLGEEAVLSYERRRVGDAWVHRVKHIAPVNAAAGYDIESVSLELRGIEPRFIEVKAVSESDLAFYWSSNEIDRARKLRTWYYLYLVPIDSRGQPKIDEIFIIADPILSVLGDSNKWSIVPSAFKCARRQPQ